MAYHADVCGEGVVTAELDLLGGDRVVLVYYRDDAHLEQTEEGPLSRLAPDGVVYYVLGHQYLPHGMSVGGEEALIYPHQLALAYRRESHLFLYRFGTALEVRARDTRRNSTRGNEYYLNTAVFDVGERACEQLDAVEIEVSVFVCEGG